MGVLTIVLWNHEPYFESPARKTFTVNWDGDLLRADLSIDVDPYAPFFGGGCVNKIVVNGTEINFVGDRCNLMSANLKNVLRRGNNVIEIHHNANPLPGIQSGGIYAYLVVESSGQVGGDVSPPVNGGSGGLDMNLVLAIVLMVVVLLVVMR